jgi:hypothetical protein
MPVQAEVSSGALRLEEPGTALTSFTKCVPGYIGQDKAIFLAKSHTLFVRSFMHLLVSAK